jgi:hypothetical protein
LHAEIAGRWPDVADQAPVAAVVVCRHVVYNAADLAPFLAALHGHAERRVVVELTELHPQSDLGPLWKAIHGIDRPSVPTAQDAIDVAGALGYDVLHVERSHEPLPEISAAISGSHRLPGGGGGLRCFRSAVFTVRRGAPAFACNLSSPCA